jgi:hypothetical protein
MFDLPGPGSSSTIHRHQLTSLIHLRLRDTPRLSSLLLLRLLLVHKPENPAFYLNVIYGDLTLVVTIKEKFVLQHHKEILKQGLLHLKSKEKERTLLTYFLHMYIHHFFKFTSIK